MTSFAPRWSVVIPTFDRLETLSACLSRLAPGAQELDASQYEVIVTDDARSERTRSELHARFPWARWTAGPARGPAANRNHGASLARGEWIVFTDDDTLPDRAWLLEYQAAAAHQPEADVLEGRTTCAAGFGTPMHYAPVNETGGRLWSCNLAMRATRFHEVGGFDEGFTLAHMEDQDLRERVRNAGARTAWVPRAIVDHPPRRQPSGFKLGAQRVAEVRYLCKHGAPVPLRWRLLKRIARLRLGIIRSLPVSVDSALALGSLATELLVVQWNFARWERAAREEFPAPSPQSVAQRAREPRALDRSAG